jgi:hypothetical protein
VEANRRGQETIVGTEALIANDWTVTVVAAGDAGNTLDAKDNSIDLPHGAYILIDSGGYLTAVRAGQMQHWTEKTEPSSIEFVEAPQDISVPRVGQLVRLEKTLVKPTDSLVITATYTMTRR